MLFLLPFFGRTLLGTTDIPCPTAEATVVSDQERTYLLEHLARWFPEGSAAEVGSAWAGGRPLIRAAGSSASSSRLVREHEVEQLPSGLISLLGGKWTTCRVLALDALQLVLARLDGAEPALSLCRCSAVPPIAIKPFRSCRPCGHGCSSSCPITPNAMPRLIT